MSTEEVFVEQFAKLFVHYRDALTLQPSANEHCVGFGELPDADRQQMVAAARLALLEIENTGDAEEDSRRYYAKPGEAEWGC